MDYLWRMAIAAIGYAVFVYVVPLFLDVLSIPVAPNLWALLKAIGAIGAICYVIWGRQVWPWRALA